MEFARIWALFGQILFNSLIYKQIKNKFFRAKNFAISENCCNFASKSEGDRVSPNV